MGAVTLSGIANLANRDGDFIDIGIGTNTDEIGAR
jgi:hypothetical protein